MEMAPAVFQFTVDNLKMKISSCHTILQVIFLSFFFVHFQDDDNNDYLEPATAQLAKTRKKVHFGWTMDCLPHRLKSTFFEIFSSGGSPKRTIVKKNFQKTLILVFVDSNSILSCQNGLFSAF